VLAISELSELPVDFADTAVAIGKFDAMHLGHQQLLHELVETAEANGLAPVVITFDRHPNAVLKPESVPVPIIGPLQKRHHIQRAGVSALLTVKFDRQFADLAAEQFIREYLVEGLGAKYVLVGRENRFGAGGRGNIQLLSDLGPKLGFSGRGVDHVTLDGERVSTTGIRKLLDAGEVARASLWLGRNHMTTGVVEHGKKLGRTFGFPTANLARDSEGYLPADGVYAGWLHVGDERFAAAHSVGTNDSVAEVPRLVESHVIGRDDLDLYGQVVSVEYVERVRGWAKFESIDQLIAQIADDVAAASNLMSSPGGLGK
jgi:riboflavin kinase/FMN adenylyltransferase